MSRMICLIIFSGCSALSIRSFKLARINVETLSSSAITPPNLTSVAPAPASDSLAPVKSKHQTHHKNRYCCEQQDHGRNDPQRLKRLAIGVVTDHLPESADQRDAH